ncbi:MAG: P-loop NTPase [Spirochaetaceae bacterium]|jgi:flagellar biosynthesis protein FlhG|nr:P-loop NTPase [Spirochaetaceae bacterium]
MQILAVASGKGGVGKSLVSANLSIALAQAGKRVILADLDLGGSNLHLILGHLGDTRGIGTYFQNRNLSLDDIIYPTSYENLRFIPGESELPGVANVSTGTKKKLMTHLLKLENQADYLVLDLGAGTSFNTMDFFLLSGCGIMVTTPTLTATLNAYLFLKNAVFRVLNNSIKRKSPAEKYLNDLKKDGVSLQRIHVAKLLEKIQKLDPEAHGRFVEEMKFLQPRLIMNMLDDPKDVKRSNKLKLSARQYLGVELEHLGVIYRDDMQNMALNSQLPIIIYKPQSVLSQAIYRIADKIMEMENLPSHPLSFGEGDLSFQEAVLEAKQDFSDKMTSLEELLNCGALTQGDLVETIKSQQFEIDQLKKENRFIKSKLIKAVQMGFNP